jgi:hypothetical protein
VDLSFVQLVFEVESNNPDLHAAFFYQALRRFDIYFRQSCCRYGSKTCQACSAPSACPYLDVFSQKLSADPDVVRRHQKPPLPFAFKIRQLPDNGSCLEICLVVVGNAVNHLPVFIAAVHEMTESTYEKCHGVSADIIGSYCLDYQSVRHELETSSNDPLNLILLSCLEIMNNTADSVDISLILESPLRLVSAGSVLHTMNFSAFLRSQLRRCSSLFAYYGDGELDIDYSGLSAAAIHVNCLSDGIKYVQPFWSQRPICAGLTGLSVFGGVSSGILPLLTLGSYLNAGKGASFGMGAYRAEVI